MGTKECPLPLVLCASDLTSAHGARIRTPHTGHAQGPLKCIPLCVNSVDHRTRIKL